MRGGSGGSVRDLPDLGLASLDPRRTCPRPVRPRWADLRPRVLSACVLVPLALAGIWVGATLWTVLVAAGVAGMALEWIQLCHLRRRNSRPLMAAGLAWVAVAGIALIWLRQDSAAGRANLLFLAPVVWASDVGAYAAGRLLGGPKLAPRISPAKTWAGAGGGLLAAIAVGLLIAALLGPWNFARAALVAAGLGLAAQAGDLVESGFKRSCGAKDSGRLIPGHGGLLDRLDGMLAAAPAAALLVATLGRGVPLW